MKKYLPTSQRLSVNTSNTSRGFTLVELMVVVAIIGILAVVSLGVFNGAQGSARDARREAEIDSLAKNIESTRDPQTGFYQYTSTMMLKDYPNGLVDPSSFVYCQKADVAVDKPDAPTTTWTTICPSGWQAIGGTTPTVTNDAAENNDLADGVGTISKVGNKGWKVCASLERTNKVFCKTNLIR